MSIIRQYRPAFFDGFENKIIEFNSLEELLSIEFVSKFKDDEIFHRYSISNGHSKFTLMCETNEGYSWWVIGHIDNDDYIKDLPIWEPKYKTTL